MLLVNLNFVLMNFAVISLLVNVHISCFTLILPASLHFQGHDSSLTGDGLPIIQTAKCLANYFRNILPSPK